MSTNLHLTEIGRIAVPAADQDRALEFYVGTLGFELRSDETFADGKMRWIEVAPAGASTAIAIAPPMEDGPTAVDTGIVISTSDIEADHAALRAAGVDVDEEIARWGDPVPPMFRLRDPSGNSLAIVEPVT
ncbi:MAG TPA: VOC family protein [Gaiellales bacterium]|jgi:catechol 2,3-dioxygenase-like lactoylglutathione lyase family enzyme